MTHTPKTPKTSNRPEPDHTSDTQEQTPEHWRRDAAVRANMHDDVPTWCDTCCCEAEQRWRDLGDEIGMPVDALTD